MSKITRYAGNLRAFASNAQGLERTLFGETTQADDLTSQVTASFLRGWGIVGASEHPSLEDFNAAMYALSQFIAYQHQTGVPEWHAEQEYYIGSMCIHGGESYQSLENNNVGNEPPSAKWTPILTSKNGLSNLGLGDGSGRLINVRTFTASGTYTPTAGTKFVIAEVLGGGGGGGSNAATPSSGAAAGAGGASGAYAVCKHTPTGPVSVVIGAGGSGGVPTALGADGSTGGATSFGAVSAPGGYGGPKGNAFNNFPTGGNVATGSAQVSGSVIVSTPGSSGSYGILYSDSNATGGGGGTSIYGAGGIAMTINAGGSGTQRGMDANGYGSGGGGAVSVHVSTAASSRGGNGSPGIVIIWEYA